MRRPFRRCPRRARAHMRPHRRRRWALATQCSLPQSYRRTPRPEGSAALAAPRCCKRWLLSTLPLADPPRHTVNSSRCSSITLTMANTSRLLRRPFLMGCRRQPHYRALAEPKAFHRTMATCMERVMPPFRELSSMVSPTLPLASRRPPSATTVRGSAVAHRRRRSQSQPQSLTCGSSQKVPMPSYPRGRAASSSSKAHQHTTTSSPCEGGGLSSSRVPPLRKASLFKTNGLSFG